MSEDMRLARIENELKEINKAIVAPRARRSVRVQQTQANPQPPEKEPRAGGLKSSGVTTPALTLRNGADTIHELTPDQMISLVSQAMTWFESVMATSWAMKDGTAPFEAGIPTDFTDDIYWP